MRVTRSSGLMQQCFFCRMVHEDVSVGFHFWVEDFVFFIEVFEEPGCGIPWVEDCAWETETFCVEVEKFYSDLYHVFKLRIFYSSGKFRGRQIRYYVKREAFCLWDESSADSGITDFLFFEWAEILPLCSLGFLCKGFRAVCVINGEKSAFRGSSSSLFLNDFLS